MTSRASDPCAHMQALTAQMLGPEFAVQVCDPRAAQPMLMPHEDAHLGRATAARRAEFAAGRHMARRALATLGGPQIAIPAGEDRAPQWPAGWRGSISHSNSLCIAAVTAAPYDLGVDLEPDSPLDSSLVATICSNEEVARIAGPDQLERATLIFAAKEAAYKAQYPRTGLLFGFDHLDISLNLAAQRFTATFIKPAGCFAVGDSLLGCFGRAAGHLVTTVVIGQGGVKGS